MLTIYRRHTTTCIKSYSQNVRVFQPQPLTKEDRKAGKRDPKLDDCECPIAAEGQLSIEGRITNRSTKATDWRKAQATAGQWEQWGQTTDPSEKLKANTIESAVASYMTTKGPKGENIQGGMKQIRVLLQLRLLPYAKENRMTMMADFDNLDVVTRFTESWVNLDRYSDEYGELLGMSTRKNQVETLRSFFRYCIDREWMFQNYASKIKFTAKTGQKVGLDHEDDERVRLVMESYKDRHVYAIYAVMRQAGLRISDASALYGDQLVTRTDGEGWALSIISQVKTQKDVYVPISNALATTLQNLPFKCVRNGKEYWFWPGNGKIKTNKTSWSNRIRTATAAAKPLKIVVTPHIFRHTFAITLMNKGTDVKNVSRLLGHASTAVTERHYSRANVGTMKALENAIDKAA
jgi:integrase